MLVARWRDALLSVRSIRARQGATLLSVAGRGRGGRADDLEAADRSVRASARWPHDRAAGRRSAERGGRTPQARARRPLRLRRALALRTAAPARPRDPRS